MFRNFSLLVRFPVLFVLILSLICGAYYLVLRKVYYTELQRQARTVADNVDAFGRWVSQYGRVWTKDNPESSHLSQIILAAANPTAPAISFYSKNPALAQREYSEVVAKSPARAKFRMTSDNWMSPLNKPDPFETTAISAIKSRSLEEYSEVREGMFRYARKIVHAESCIACHGSPSAAPEDVTSRYGTERGYGFKAGDVAGVISVTLPMDSLLQRSLALLGPIEIGLILGAFIILYVFVHFDVVQPIKRLTLAAKNISLGKPVDLDVSRIPQKSGSEIVQLMLSIGRLRMSMDLAIQRMKQAGSAPPPPPPEKPPQDH